MQPLVRTRALVAAGSLVLLAALTACGGDSGGDGDGGGSSAPDNASTEDFCQAFNGLVESVLAEADVTDSSGMVAAIKDWAEDMEAVGTPSDMPDEAREGFEVFVEQAKNLDEDASLADLQTLGDDVSADDAKAGLAFSSWTTENCPMDLPTGLPSDLASDLASDLPSDFPTELPSDFPTDLPTDPSELASMMSELTAGAGS